MYSDIEGVEYPFIPGERGIPFQQLIERVAKREYTGRFTAGSGRTLRYLINDKNIEIKDVLNTKYYMDATASIDGSVSFLIRTRLFTQKRRTEGRLTEEDRHKDMDAKKFIGFALDYFTSKGINITTCRGVWQIGNSDNFDTFMEEYQKHHDKVRAAKSTWSGKTFGFYGFTHIEEDNIELRGDNSSPVQILADFLKPDNR